MLVLKYQFSTLFSRFSGRSRYLLANLASTIIFFVFRSETPLAIKNERIWERERLTERGAPVVQPPVKAQHRSLNKQREQSISYSLTYQLHWDFWLQHSEIVRFAFSARSFLFDDRLFFGSFSTQLWRPRSQHCLVTSVGPTIRHQSLQVLHWLAVVWQLVTHFPSR